LEIFRGVKNPLSNFYPTQIQIDNEIYPTAEHLYQHHKAIALHKPDIAAQIMTTHRAIDALHLGQSINNDTDTTLWDNDKLGIMRLILNLKYEACAEFREKLLGSMDRCIVESTANLFWASGLPPKATANQPMDSWPGKNKLGHLLMELRTMKRDVPCTPRTDHNSEAIHLAEELITKAIDPL